jgi:hypothetical protein
MDEILLSLQVLIAGSLFKAEAGNHRADLMMQHGNLPEGEGMRLKG